jgi:hypothetical protein
MRNYLQFYAVSEQNELFNWGEVQEENPFLTQWTLSIINSGLKDIIKTVIVEPLYICKDHRNLFSNYYSKQFNMCSPISSRIHFFSNIIDINNEHPDISSYQESYIGFSVIRPVKERSIGRTIIDPKFMFCNNDNFFCLRTKYSVNINGDELFVQGYPFTAQDTDVTVCAHASLWGLCRYLSERYTLYKEVYPFDIVKMTENNQGRVFPYRGMTYSDYSKILSEFGCFPIIIRLKNNSTDEIDPIAFKDLYSYVESGFPTLASFQGHVITLIGHTIDYNKKVKDENGFIDSSSFLKQFIVVDDNCFPYQRLGYKGDVENYGNNIRINKYITSIVTAVCPLPEKVFLNAKYVRTRCYEHLTVLRNELKINRKDFWVTRLFLTSSKPFKKRKLKEYKANVVNGKKDEISLIVSSLHYPHFIWVMEISTLDEYKSKKCFGEIIIDSTANPKEDITIYSRFFNTLFLEKKKKIISDQIKIFSQYTHNLGEI